MDDLNKANERLNKLTDKDVRIAYLPPATVGSIYSEAADSPAETGDLQAVLVVENNLQQVKPDFRHYGLNHYLDGKQAYERWITIPDDLTVKPPFEKKNFAGGMYAGYSIWFSDFIQAPYEAWKRLQAWAQNHVEYEIAPELPWFEEHLNDMRYSIWPSQNAEQQLDLLIPIQRKSS